MKHVFKAQKIGWDAEQEGVWFDADQYTKEEATAEFKPYEAISQKSDNQYSKKYMLIKTLPPRERFCSSMDPMHRARDLLLGNGDRRSPKDRKMRSCVINRIRRRRHIVVIKYLTLILHLCCIRVLDFGNIRAIIPA